MRFDNTTAINVKNAMFLDVKPCCLADRRQISEENTSCLFTIEALALRMEAERSSEMYLSFKLQGVIFQKTKLQNLLPLFSNN